MANGRIRAFRDLVGLEEAASVKVCRRERLLSTTNPLREVHERGHRNPS